MPLPQVNDRIKEIPAQALRAVFAGIGQVLLVADRLRARAAEQTLGQRRTAAAPPAQPGPGRGPRRAKRASAAHEPPAQDADDHRAGGRWTRPGTSGCSRADEQAEADLAVPPPGRPSPRRRSPLPPGQSPGRPRDVQPLAEYTPTEPAAASARPARPPEPAGAPRPRRAGSAACRTRPRSRRPGASASPAAPDPAAGPAAAAAASRRPRPRRTEPLRQPPARPCPLAQLRRAVRWPRCAPGCGCSTPPRSGAARLREGPRGPAGRDHHVRAPHRQARAKAAEADRPRSAESDAAAHHGA